MNVIDITQGANKALAILRGSGAVGYEETNVYSMTADADVTGKVTDSTEVFIKISDYTPTMDELNGQMITVVFSNGEIETQELKLEDTLQQISDEAFAVSECFVVVNKAGAEVDGVVFPEVGIYAIHPREFAENKWESVTVTLKTIHPIDPKYLPGVCLSVLDISDVTIPAESAELTAEHHAMLVELATKRQPFFLCARLGDADDITTISGVPAVSFWSDGSETEIFVSLEVKIPGSTLTTFTLCIFATNEGSKAALYVNGSSDWAG